MEPTSHIEPDHLAQNSSRHVLLCKEILQALNTSMLTESGVGIGSAILTSLWANSITQSRAQSGQPYPSRITPARENAIAQISSIPRWQQIPTYASWHQALSANQFSTFDNRAELSTLFRQIYDISINGTNVSAEEIKQWAREMAVILIEQERWGRSLNKALNQAVSDERITPGAAIQRIDSLLMGQPEAHLVVVGVTGATAIEGLDSLIGTKVRVLKDERTSPHFSGWGTAGGDAKNFIDFICRPSETFRDYALRPTTQICLEVTVDAVGIESAAEEGRRVVLRLIDQLSAVHPTARLRPTDIVGVRAPRSGKFAVHRFEPKSPGIVRANLSAPPTPLKESIRAAALIRRLEDPLTQAAFSWVSFEIAGFKISDVKECGKALALFSLRQQAILSYRHLMRGVGDLSGLKSRYRKESKLARKRARRLRRHRPQKPEDRARLSGLIEAQEHAATNSDQAHKLVTNRFRKAQELINRISVCAPGYEFGKERFGQIVDMTSWQQQLATIEDEVNLHELMTILPKWATTTAKSTGKILSEPSNLNRWLRDSASYYGKLLDGLYSARNVHLHSGVSDIPGSTSLGHASALLTDALIEICLYWQQPGSQESPLEIVKEVAGRFDQLMDDADSYELDLDNVLAPICSDQ